MRKCSKPVLGFLVLILIFGLLTPAEAAAVPVKYGIVIGDKADNYHLYDDMVILSPSNNVMIKVQSISKALGLSYRYTSATGKLTLQNPYNGKSIVFTKGKKSFRYYSSKTAKGSTKTAAYPCYYDNTEETYVVHASTLKYLLQYRYYKNFSDTYYSDMGYRRIIGYSINGYSSYDLPVADEVIDYVNQQTFTTKPALLRAVHVNLITRNPEFTCNTTKGVLKELGTEETILNDVLEIDYEATSKDADYLSLLIDSFSQNWRTKTTTRVYPDGRKEVIESDSDPATLTIKVEYETTLAQERVVDSKIASILKKLKLGNATDAEKVKAIHDYIINRASYDNTYQKSTAYDLLIHKTSVCEGYALTAYRLFRDAGLDSRIITGKGDGEDHAWNIVKVGEEWYNIDLTWDDPVSSTGEQILRYDYFLKNESDFTDHIRDAEFITPQFLMDYPTADKSY